MHRVLLRDPVYDRAKAIAEQMHITVPAVLAAALEHYEHTRTANLVKATALSAEDQERLMSAWDFED